jgi:hypothetical protein
MAKKCFDDMTKVIIIINECELVIKKVNFDYDIETKQVRFH